MIERPDAATIAETLGLRRRGTEWAGPCPRCGGKDRFHVRSGDGLFGCRGCGDDAPGLFKAVMEACGLEPPERAPTHHAKSLTGATVLTSLTSPPKKGAAAALNPRPVAATGSGARRVETLWAGASALTGSPGVIYLRDVRRVLEPHSAPPDSVRWVSLELAHRASLAPRLPAGAVGAILYRFTAPGDDTATRAAQVEAIDTGGRAVTFETAGKRPSVAGSNFARGARVFVARTGKPEARVHLCEGPIDALALAVLGFAGDGDRIIAAAGTAGMQPAAVPSNAPVTLYPDGDAPGRAAAVRLKHTAEPNRFTIHRQPPGADLADLARIRATP